MTDTEFEFLFERSASLAAFRSFYAAADECYTDYAARVVRRHQNLPSSGCGECRGAENLVPAVAKWEIGFQNAETTRLNYFLLPLAVGGHPHRVVARIGFETHHIMCRACCSRWAWMRRLTGTLRNLFLVITIAGAAALLLASIYVGMMLFYGDPVSPGGPVTAIAGLFCLCTCYPLISWTAKAGVPRGLRSIAKNPVRLVTLQPRLGRPSRLR